MDLREPPVSGSWRHAHGFEVAFFSDAGAGHRMWGHTAARDGEELWSVGYDIETDAGWRTIGAHASATAPEGMCEVSLQRDHQTGWTVDGHHRPDLQDCVDIDIESSAVTNTLPLHRLDFTVGTVVEVPAAFVRAGDLRVERLEQRYTLLSASPAAARRRP